MATLTLSRQLGSQGDAVAQAVAQRLGYRVLYHELINQARHSGQASQPEMALGFLDVLGLLDLRPSAQDRFAYQQAMQEIMAEQAVSC